MGLVVVAVNVIAPALVQAGVAKMFVLVVVNISLPTEFDCDATFKYAPLLLPPPSKILNLS